MKPRNFPGRVNARRKGAFGRLPKTPYRPEITEMERGALANRIVADSSARGVRTKKDRSAGAKIRGAS